MFLSIKSAGDPKGMSSQKRTSRKTPIIIDDSDSGDHTCDEEIDTEEDSVGSLVDFVVDDDIPVEFDECKKESLSDDDAEVKEVEIVESAMIVQGLRRSTRNRKPVERYVDSDYEELMCADANPKDALESGESEEEEDTEEAENLGSDSDMCDTCSD